MYTPRLCLSHVPSHAVPTVMIFWARLKHIQYAQTYAYKNHVIVLHACSHGYLKFNLPLYI